MTQMTYIEVTAIENARAMARDHDTDLCCSKSLQDRLMPYLGTGVRASKVASDLGCTTQAIGKALRRMGARLK